MFLFLQFRIPLTFLFQSYTLQQGVSELACSQSEAVLGVAKVAAAVAVNVGAVDLAVVVNVVGIAIAALVAAVVVESYDDRDG